MTQLRTLAVTLPDSGASVTVRESISLDVIDGSAIYAELSYDRHNKRDLNRAGKFADAALRSTVKGMDRWVSLDDAKDGELQKSFEAWQTLSGSDLAVWANALINVNKVVDPNAAAPKSAGASSKRLTDTSSTSETPTKELQNSAVS